MRYYLTPEDYETAEKNGINKEQLYHRVYIKNWSIQRAISTPMRPVNKWGWREWKEVALKHNVRYHLYVQRMRLGWTQEEAATTLPLSKQQVMDLMNERKSRLFTPEQLQIAAENNLPHSIIWNRVRILKWDIETAITTPVISKEESLKRARQASSLVMTTVKRRTS